MNYSEEWKQRCAARRAAEKAPEPAVIQAPIIEQPEGPLFMIFRRTVTGHSKTLYMGLTRHQAEHQYMILNKKEAVKREGTKPERLVFFDIVEQGKPEQLSPYFNFRPTLLRAVN